MDKLIAQVKEALWQNLRSTIPASIDPMRDAHFESAAKQAIEIVIKSMVIRETDHWITFDFSENSGEGFAMWKNSGDFYEMHEHAIDGDPIEIQPLRPGLLPIPRD